MLRIPSDSLSARVVLTLAIVLTILTGPVQAQDRAPQRATVMANGDLAARWAPYKIRELIHRMARRMTGELRAFTVNWRSWA